MVISYLSSFNDCPHLFRNQIFKCIDLDFQLWIIVCTGHRLSYDLANKWLTRDFDFDIVLAQRSRILDFDSEEFSISEWTSLQLNVYPAFLLYNLRHLVHYAVAQNHRIAIIDSGEVQIL